MRRIEYDRYGGPERMRLAPFDPPALGASDLLVEVRAASINPVDWAIRSGKMQFLTGSSFPRTMGKDLAGTVVEVGSDVTGWRVGEAVLGCVPWRRTGSFATVAVVRPAGVVKKPESLSFVEAAALPTVGLTAWHGLVLRAELRKGQSVLINGAGGGVGDAAVQIARSLGARVTARVGARSLDRVRTLDVDAVLDYRDALPAALDASFDVVLDAHGSLSSRDIDRVMKRGGRAVDITYRPAKVLRSLVLRRQKLASGSVDQATLSAVARLAASGDLRPHVPTVVSLDDAIPLIAGLEAGRSIEGKAVIDFSHGAGDVGGSPGAVSAGPRRH